jgi:hypothetical protein
LHLLFQEQSVYILEVEPKFPTQNNDHMLNCSALFLLVATLLSPP